MEKRNYEKTAMKVVEFKQQQHLLQMSGTLTQFNAHSTQVWGN